jgi:hypothetical protein
LNCLSLEPVEAIGANGSSFKLGQSEMVGTAEGGMEWVRLSCHLESRMIRMRLTCIAIPLRAIDSLGHLFLCNDGMPLLSVEEKCVYE